ncbi:MAG: flagellar basal-body MS-ring/collar protein FliF, partial [Vicinamibacterales bacterium]|nr:flagellar basal-body MS-ring/collar protein FliF [Vicinamibacterales bacterium]
DAESAGDFVGRLKAAKVPYELAEGGRTIRVPENRADELRLEFSAQGLPTSGRVGFEIFDKVSFGATEFVEQVNFKRALEGEIARTISTLSEVSSARVHIAIAKTSLFETREQPAKASVFLKLKGNRPLNPSTARGICTLVASSVEGLRPEAVAILDSYGRSLARPGDDQDSALTGPAIERQLTVERDLTTKLVSLLEPVAGPGSVRVNVAVRLTAATEEQTEERWDPNAAVIRSRQTTSDQTPVAGTTGGIAGARANMPDATAAAAQAVNLPKPAPADVRLAGRSAETTNYEISHTRRHTIRPQGEIARLSVAVILDDQMVVSTGSDGAVNRTFKPRDAAELQKIQGIVASAVGIDTTRGDQLTVENVSFDERLLLTDDTPPDFWEAQKPHLIEVGRIVGIVFLGLVAFLTFVRPVVKRALAVSSTPVQSTMSEAEAPALPGPTERAKTVADLEGAIEAELEAAELAVGGDRKRIPVLSKRLAGMTQKEPEQAARLIRAWLQEDRASR